MSSANRIRLVDMGAVQEATITLGEAARRLGITVDALLELIYDGRLIATADPATGRLLVKSDDLEYLEQ
jgi:excisionase family DNA binding protein